jgi:hypothetical protein
VILIPHTVGSGYTVEGQKTGEEKHGGLQLEIVPSYEPNLRLWSMDDFENIPKTIPEWYNTSKTFRGEEWTPRQINLQAGDTIKSFPVPAFWDAPCVISDLVDRGSSGVTTLKVRG